MIRRRPTTNPLRRGKKNPFKQDPIQQDPLEVLMQLCRRAEIDIPKETLGKALAYLVRMLEENKKLNLTGIRELNKALVLHLLDSLWIFKAVPQPPERILDIGSGNGFPGAIAACLWPQAQSILVERTLKKARAIEACLRDTKIQNATVLAEDAAALPAHHEGLKKDCDLILTRATGRIADMNRLAAPLLNTGGSVFHWKSETVDSMERREGLISAKKLQLIPRDDLIYPLGDRKRRLLRFDKP
jgi:16S rRNA (guanine527-N7)-methyltransferase